MWSSPVGLPLVYQQPSILPEGKALLIQPQVEEKPIEYLVVQPSKEPYQTQEYVRRLWIC
tara:strand:+ start:8 stop:187 length:180 start_codon:yes stop_codon:yes gene_type:complete